MADLFSSTVAEPDYILDIDSLKPARNAEPTLGAGSPGSPGSLRGRPWLAVRWSCCSVYSRVYRNRRGSAYEGRCPRCGKEARFHIGPGGTDCRFFEVH